MKENHAQAELSNIALEILAYLHDHPDAEDTLDGMMAWWLLEQKIKHQTALVKQALSKLADKGLVIEKRRRGVPPSYRINPDKDTKDLIKPPPCEHIIKAINGGT